MLFKNSIIFLIVKNVNINEKIAAHLSSLHIYADQAKRFQVRAKTCWIEWSHTICLTEFHCECSQIYNGAKFRIVHSLSSILTIFTCVYALFLIVCHHHLPSVLHWILNLALGWSVWHIMGQMLSLKLDAILFCSMR